MDSHTLKKDTNNTKIDTTLQGLKVNFLFWIILIICLLIINKSSGKYKFYETIISFYLAAVTGFFSHVISHSYDFEKLYTESDNCVTRFLKQDINLNSVILFFARQFDFHSKIHHNSTINKQPLNILIECIQNIISQGSLVLISSINILGLNFNVDKNAILFWTLIYVTVHNINYNFVNRQLHINHHIDETTNYGMIFQLDNMFNSNYDVTMIENNNYYIINIIVITVLIIVLKIYV
jgi:hypothetical protein